MARLRQSRALEGALLLMTLPDANVASDPAGVCIDKKSIFEIQALHAGDRFGLPGLATVSGPRNKTIPARDPSCGCSDSTHSVDCG
jgi:hypothetical protein